jgi:hypothetical protein
MDWPTVGPMVIRGTAYGAPATLEVHDAMLRWRADYRTERIDLRPDEIHRMALVKPQGRIRWLYFSFLLAFAWSIGAVASSMVPGLTVLGLVFLAAWLDDRRPGRCLRITTSSRTLTLSLDGSFDSIRNAAALVGRVGRQAELPEATLLE